MVMSPTTCLLGWKSRGGKKRLKGKVSETDDKGEIIVSDSLRSFPETIITEIKEVIHKIAYY